MSYFFTELAAVSKAGVNAAAGFSLMADGEEDPARRKLLERLYEQTDAGVAVSKAMEEAGVFPDYVLQMVRIGEQSGSLDTVFPSLARHCDDRIRIAQVLRGAVVYPAILFAVMLVVLFVFITRILPVFGEVFKQIGASMSAGAAAFLRFGLGLRAARWWLVGAVALLVLLVLAVRLIPALRSRFGAWLRRVAARTGVGRKIGVARFASALELAYAGGVELDEAMTLARFFCDDPAVAGAVDRCRRRMLDGESIAAAFTAEKLFSPMCCHMLAIGVQTGETEAVLKDIARRTGEEMDAAVDKLTGAVEPVIVIVLCVCVGLLLLGVMLPLVGIMSAL